MHCNIDFGMEIRLQIQINYKHRSKSWGKKDTSLPQAYNISRKAKKKKTMPHASAPMMCCPIGEGGMVPQDFATYLFLSLQVALV